MNKAIYLLLYLIWMQACVGKHSSSAPPVLPSSSVVPAQSIGDTVWIDTALSVILWKGTKMRGAGKHEGDIRLAAGYLITSGGQYSGGAFTIDMPTIRVTDIPAHEPIPRGNLTRHLKSADFFDVDQYPIATLEITSIQPRPDNGLDVSGNMTIKDVTRHISFETTRQDHGLTAQFTFDRFDWHIAYEGSWVDKTLVDRDVELTIKLILH